MDRLGRMAFLFGGLVLLQVVMQVPREIRAEVVFEFDYSGSPEFLDLQEGAERREALEDAARRLGRVFRHDAQIQLQALSEFDPQSDTLASASGEVVPVADDFFGFAANVVEHKILNGADPNGELPDGQVVVNFGNPWDFDDDIGPDHYDFKATMIHELLHALGFVSGVFQDGTDLFDTPPGSPGVWAPFDRFLSNKFGERLIDDTSFALDDLLWQAQHTGGASPDSGLFFDGPLARAANGGRPVGIYSPGAWEDGSSGSHLDDDNPALAGMVMLAATDTGPYTRELSVIERAILQDLGYALVSPDLATEIELSLVSLSSTEAILELVAGPGEYRLRMSSDLRSWNEIATAAVEVGQTPVVMAVDIRQAGPAAFFSARRIAP